jgi:predicted RNase H-like nuclease
MIIAGSDRSKAGWLTLVLVNGVLKAHLYPDFNKLLQKQPALDVLVADVPIGLPHEYPRQCDKLARETVKPRHNSVFMTPLRQVLDCSNHSEANSKHRELAGVGLSQQAFHILPAICEVDNAIQAGEISADILHEGHPEVSFWAINGKQGIMDYKKTPVGHYFRRRLLEREFGEDHLPAIRKQFPLKRQAADDDIVDALAMLWTAQRIAAGKAERIPAQPDRDKTGIDMAIWY